MPFFIFLPDYVHQAVRLLNAARYEAWTVGGGVRDSLLGIFPHDWDIATNATPEQILAVFEGFRCILTGMRHGTVTVMIQQTPLEITTYRVDAVYRDHRHPSEVSFCGSLKEDLRRRDFTINAMAYHPQKGLYDPFGGWQDLNNKCIRCVGDPFARLEEDALRILRALRFGAQLGFAIHPDTAQALLQKAAQLRYISYERAYAEISRLLQCVCITDVLLRFSSVFAIWWPVLGQYTPKQWQTTVSAIQALPGNLPLRLAAMCFGLWDRTEEGLALLLEQLRIRCVTRKIRQQLQALLNGVHCCHDATLPGVKRLLGEYGSANMQNILLLRKALFPNDTPMLEHMQAMIQEILQSGACYQISQLAIHAKDLMRLGMQGQQIGRALAFLCDAVIEGKCENAPNDLLEYLQHFPMA